MTRTRRLTYGFCILLLLGCGNDDDSSSFETGVDDAYTDALNDVELNVPAGASVTGESLVGTWMATQFDGTETVTFRADGSGTLEESWEEDGHLTEWSGPFAWEMKNNVLADVISERFTEDGVSCSETEQDVFTVARVNDALVMDALLRTVGTGSGYAGTWRAIFGEYEVWQCGSEREKGYVIDDIALELTETTFTLTDAWEEMEEWQEDGETDSDTYRGVDSWTGTVTVQDNFLILTPDDPSGQDTPVGSDGDRIITIRLLNNLVAQMDWSGALSDEDFETDMYYRQ